MIMAQISDPHISIESGRPDARGETELQRAVTHLNRLPAPPDIVLLSGDCAEHGAAAECERLDELLRDLHAPLYLIPGNHDDRSMMLAAFGPQGAQAHDGYVQYVVEGYPVRLILLGTSVPGQDAGRLSDAQLKWLQARLTERPEQPIGYRAQVGTLPLELLRQPVALIYSSLAAQ
jgi:3',5'-cyclic AMP phosphodiesterase CpdA